jgi:hypothetical protein
MMCKYEQNYKQNESKFYFNDGSGFFIEHDTKINQVGTGDFAIGDVNGDNLLDIMIIGEFKDTDSTTQIFINLDNGNFVKDSVSQISQFEEGEIHFIDFENDGDLDVIFTGNITWNIDTTIMYLNDGTGNLSFNNSILPNNNIDMMKVIDFNNDGYDDVLYNNSALYINNNGTSFYKNTEVSPYFISSGTFEIFDANNDDFLDILIVGSKYPDGLSNLFLNDQGEKLTKIESCAIPGWYFSVAEFNDINNDGDMDLFVSGLLYSGNSTGRLYVNNGSGGFTQLNTVLNDATQGGVAFGDIDGDGDDDMLLTSESSATSWQSYLYKNNNGRMDRIIDHPFSGSSRGDCLLLDVNGDGYLDAVMSGAGNMGHKYYLDIE